MRKRSPKSNHLDPEQKDFIRTTFLFLIFLIFSIIMLAIMGINLFRDALFTISCSPINRIGFGVLGCIVGAALFAGCYFFRDVYKTWSEERRDAKKRRRL